MEQETFLNDPVTKDLFDLIREHRDASHQALTETMINAPSLANVDMCILAEYKGQVQAFNLLLDIQNFLEDRLERKKTHAEDDSLRS